VRGRLNFGLDAGDACCVSNGHLSLPYVVGGRSIAGPRSS